MSEPRTRVLFVCLGNICRSPTAEAVMRRLTAEAGLEREIEIESCGTGTWHVGQPPDERATAAAAERGIALTGTARRLEPGDLDRFDYVLAMDRDNLAELRALQPGSPQRARIGLLREFDSESVAAGAVEVPDPYYGEHGFEQVLDLVEAACGGLLAEIAPASGADADI